MKRREITKLWEEVSSVKRDCGSYLTESNARLYAELWDEFVQLIHRETGVDVVTLEDVCRLLPPETDLTNETEVNLLWEKLYILWSGLLLDQYGKRIEAAL